MRDLTWMDSALCAQTDPELFFPDENAHYYDARQICGRCPVADQCGAYAQDLEDEHGDRHGAWAGTTPRQRGKGRPARRGTPRSDRDAIRRLSRSGLNADEIAAALDITARTVYRALAQQTEAA
ncbi:WhiB family transcriptional regulator [Streptomyces uncialis]|uniref:WhiB family transcriptional regulator n=1 Tax=Streptomyces uncialis TaxID=1048205 RepID=UPI00382EE7F5